MYEECQQGHTGTCSIQQKAKARRTRLANSAPRAHRCMSAHQSAHHQREAYLNQQ